jgi:hypothetical protein
MRTVSNYLTFSGEHIFTLRDEALFAHLKPSSKDQENPGAAGSRLVRNEPEP